MTDETARPLLAEALTCYASGNYRGALALARRAVAASDDAAALVVWVNAATRADALDDAIEGLEQLHARFPADDRFSRMLSTALNHAASRRTPGDESAVAGYERALVLWPDNVEALYTRALAARFDGDDVRAAGLLARAVALRPDDIELALEHHGAALAGKPGDARAAFASLLPALPSDLAPRAAQLAAIADDGELACSALARADSIDACMQAAAILASHGDADNARCAFARGATLGGRGIRAPSLRACIGERLTLPAIPADEAALARGRQGFAEGLARLEDEFDASSLSRCESGLSQLQWSNFLLAYQGEDDLALQSRYGDFAVRAARILAPDFARPPSRSEPRRVAIVSGFLRDSTIGAYFESWFGALAKAGFEVTAFALGPRHDAVTDRLAARVASLVRLDGSLESMAESIRATRARLVLYPELGMDERVFALAALRLAPVQAAAWGHPVTSGLPTIDAWFTCAAMEPPDAASHYRERLLPLPGLGTAYRAPEPPVVRGRDELGLPGGRLYLVPQSAFKLHPDDDAVLAAIAATDGEARLVLFDNERPGATRRLRARLVRALAAAGAGPDRLVFVPLTSRQRYLSINAACDVMVDTQRWSGGNTTLDALRAGLPVVTLPGRYMRARQSAAMLELLGLGPDLVVAQPDELARRAVAVACDGALRARLRAALVERLPTLLDGRDALDELARHVAALGARIVA
ncbi:MAG TPA: hypothetical protein VND91_06420 [Candidatus Saccharimonadia bacterium]|nr:hypothetical protein [Candidatus Saccharimonadia bacterium]